MPEQSRGEDHPARRLGRKLKESRIAAGYRSQEEFGTQLNMHRSGVAKIEIGARNISPELLRKWCELCHVDYELFEASARLAWVAAANPIPVWFEDFAAARRLAHTIRTWHAVVVPGSLQTPGYARALYEVMGLDDDRIDELVANRIDLQEVFTRTKRPVTLLAVVDEAALRRQVGTSDDMYRQLVHLIEMGNRRNVGIQVVPASRGCNAGHVGAFTIASLPDAPDVLLTEGAVQDVTTDNRGALMQAHAIFDRVRLDALSKAESLGFIKELADQCKPGQ